MNWLQVFPASPHVQICPYLSSVACHLAHNCISKYTMKLPLRAESGEPRPGLASENQCIKNDLLSVTNQDVQSLPSFQISRPALKLGRLPVCTPSGLVDLDPLPPSSR